MAARGGLSRCSQRLLGRGSLPPHHQSCGSSATFQDCIHAPGIGCHLARAILCAQTPSCASSPTGGRNHPCHPGSAARRASTHSRSASAIQYYLARDPSLQLFNLPVPGMSTIYRILKKHQRIAERYQPEHQPYERPTPLSHWQIDAHSTSPACQPILMASGCMWWKPVMSSMWGLPSCSMPMYVPILLPRRLLPVS